LEASVLNMKSLFAASVVIGLAACGAHGGGGDSAEHYAVGTYLFSGNMIVGATDCTFDAPPGVLDGNMIKQPGTITEKCPKTTNKIVAEYADHIAITADKKVKVGDKVSMNFELRNAKNERLTPTLSEMGDTKLSDGCTALGTLGREGAQDTGRDPFMSATASAPGTCKVSIDIELPVAGGTKKHHAEQDITVAAK
jgi:hypothetical protein